MTCENLHNLARERQLVLASKSPRRVRILRAAGVQFEQMVPDIDESQYGGEPPFEYARRMAEAKAQWVSARLNGNQVTIGCDTIVVLRGEVLGKPEDAEDAVRILSRLSGQEHVVCSAVALASRGHVEQSAYDTTTVVFNRVTEEQLRTYVESGEPMDKAGAYGIQGMGAFLVDRTEGHLDTVIGLPCNLLDELAGFLLKRLQQQQDRLD